MQTAVNPQTGERVQWDGTAWVPAGSPPQAQRTAPQMQPGEVIRTRQIPLTPIQESEQARKAAAEARAETQLGLSIEASNRQAAAADRQAAAQERQNVASSRIPEARMKVYEEGLGTFGGLASALKTFKPEYGGNPLGRAENALEVTDYLGGFAGMGLVDPGQREFWSQVDAVDNAIRNSQFGATLTPGEKAAYARTTVTPSMTPEAIKENLGRRVEVLRKSLERQRRLALAEGYNPEAVDILFEPVMQAMETPTQDDGAKDETAPDMGGTGYNLPGGDTSLGTPGRQIQMLIDRGLSADKLNEWSQSAFGKPIGTVEEVNALINQRKAGQEIPNDEQIITPGDYVDPQLFAQMQEQRGSGIGYDLDAAIRGIADTATLGSADRISAAANTLFGEGTYEQNLLRERTISRADEEVNPISRLAGQIAGGVALPGAGVQSVRGLAGLGAAYGGAYGFQSDYGDIGDRLGSAFTGAVTGGALGGILGQGAKLYRNRGARAAAENYGRPETQAMQAAERQDVDLTAADVGGPMTKRLFQGTIQTPFGSGRLTEAVETPIEQMAARVSQLAESPQTPRAAGDVLRNVSRDDIAGTTTAIRSAMGPTLDETAVGQLLQRGAARLPEETQRRAARLYEAVPISAQQPANLTATRQALQDFTAEMQSNPELGALFTSPRLSAYLNALTPQTTPTPTGILAASGQPITRDVTSGGGLSWDDMMRFRTVVGDMLDEPRLGEKIAPRQLRGLYAALTRDMEATARSVGERAYNSWRRANNYYDGAQKRINNTLSIVTGQRKDMTPNEATAALTQLFRSGSTGDAAAAERILRSIPPQDAQIVRSSILQKMTGGERIDPETLAKEWGALSERGKSALLPQPGMRAIMDDMAERAVMQTRDPFAGKSSEDVYFAFERMAAEKGDSREFAKRLAALSPEDATAVRSTIISRLGKASYGQQDAAGDVFSPNTFLTNWARMSDASKDALLGKGQLRDDMNDLAKVAEVMRATDKLRGFSNSGGIASVNASTAGLAGAGVAAATGNFGAAALLAAPAVSQAVTARLLTYRPFVRWLAGMPKDKPVDRAYVAKLQRMSTRNPAIQNDLASVFRAANDNVLMQSPGRAAAQEENQ